MVAGHFEGGGDGVVHVGVSVLRQSSSKEHAAFARRQFAVLAVEGSVAAVVHGIVGLLARREVVGIFVGDDGGWLLAKLEVLVLNRPRIWHFALGVVHHGVALEVGRGEVLVLEAQAAVVEVTEAVAVELVDAPREQDFFGFRFEFAPVVEEIRVELQVYFSVIEQGVDEEVVSALRDALVGVVEVVVVEGEPQRQAADDECRQFGCRPSPLLFGLSLDELFVDVASAEF